MSPQAYIFIGRSGSGKGTQAKLLMDTLAKVDPTRKILYIQTGQELRKFIQGNSFVEQSAKKVYDAGGLQPTFLMVYLWTKVLLEQYTGNEHLIFDGTPRRVHEAMVMNSFFDFFNIANPWVLDINISPEEAMKRLLDRKRFDDNKMEIKKRLEWFESEVAPILELFDSNERYKFLKINGERPIEDIHTDIVKRVNLS